MATVARRNHQARRWRRKERQRSDVPTRRRARRCRARVRLRQERTAHIAREGCLAALSLVGEPIAALHPPFSKSNEKFGPILGGNPLGMMGERQEQTAAGLGRPLTTWVQISKSMRSRWSTATYMGVTTQQPVLPRNSCTVTRGTRAHIGRDARPLQGGQPHIRAPRAAGGGAWFSLRVAETGNMTTLSSLSLSLVA